MLHSDRTKYCDYFWISSDIMMLDVGAVILSCSIEWWWWSSCYALLSDWRGVVCYHQVVTVHFEALDLEKGYDFVRLYDGVDSTQQLIVTLTGTEYSQFGYRSTQQYLLFTFNSDDYVSRTGFIARYTTSNDISQCRRNTTHQNVKYFKCDTLSNLLLYYLSTTRQSINHFHVWSGQVNKSKL